jgi:diguanylate cyclase (GGDEF)-like protein
MQLHPFALVLAVAAAIELGVAIYVWRRRQARGATPLAVLNLALAEWAGTYAIMWSATTLEAQVFWLSATFVGVVLALPALLAFALEYAHLGRYLTRPTLALLAVHPVVTLALLVTDPWHHLFYSGYALVTRNNLLELDWERGPWFWVTTGYGYLVLLTVVAVLVRAAWRSPRLYQAQATSMVAAVLFPWIANFITQSTFRYFSELDLTPVMFSLAGVAMAYGLYRHQLLDLVPVARGVIFERIEDGVLVLDGRNRIVDANLTATRVLGRGQNLVGRAVEEVLAEFPDLLTRYGHAPRAQAEVQVGEATLELQITPLAEGRPEPPDSPGGRVIVWRDATARKQAEAELRAANERLQTQLAEIAALQTQLQEAAIRDPLTGLYNRRYLGETLPRELSRAARECYPVAVVILDIDFFKQVNDTFGHAAGDRVLRWLAAVLTAQTRAGDLACRYGGEEFLVLLPNTTAAQAAQRAEAWRAAFADPHQGPPDLPARPTLSAGVTEFTTAPRAPLDPDGLIHEADMALYAAKQGGRNRVALHRPTA